MEEEDAMENAVPCSTRYKNKVTVVMLKEWQLLVHRKDKQSMKSMRLNKVLAHLLRQ